MRRRSVISWVAAVLASATLAGAWVIPSHAATLAQVSGEIEMITIDNINDHWSGGSVVVGGQVVTLPANLLIDLPANRLTLKQIYDQAPAACVAAGETGLAKGDICNASGVGGFATISANRTSGGNVIAGDVLIEKGREAITGDVTFINYDQGYFRLNGTVGDDTTGVKVRLNDPTGRHTVQSGPECLASPLNCSPDPRFTLDPDNYTNVFSTGYPICIPSTVSRTFTEPLNYDVDGSGTTGDSLTTAASATGTGDLLCPDTNRPPTPLANPITAADSRRFAPIMVGDNLTAEGNFETIAGVRFLSTHTIMVSRAMVTRGDADQPDYFFIAEFEIDAPGFQNQRARTLIIGYSTLGVADPPNPPAADVLFWTLHRDPVNNVAHEYPLASVRGCDRAAGQGTCGAQGLAVGGGGANIFRIRYDVDFGIGAKDKLNPCMHLRNEPRFQFANTLCPGSGAGGAGDEFNVTDMFGILSPIPHEVQARTGHKLADADGVLPDGLLVTIDVKGAEATNGQYLFPLGINLGGVSIPEMNEIDLNALGTPFLFSGIPWNLDRRLSPGGCIDTNADGAVDCGAGPVPLAPFPFEGLDPRTQASLLPAGAYSDLNYTAASLLNVRNRILSFVDAAGAFSGVLLWPPANPAAFPVAVTPVTLPSCGGSGVNTPVTAVDDAASTFMNIAATIDVLANDTGTPNPASIGTVGLATNGTATPNANGTVTFTPTGDFTGLASFVYTVNDRLGNPSNNATVTIQVNPGIVGAGALPIAAGDAASTLDTTPVIITVLANDTFNGLPIVDPAAAVNILAQPAPGTGTVAVNPDNTVTFTPVVGFQGEASFTYAVTTTGPMTSNLAAVAVTVTRVNTAPLLTAIPAQSAVFGTPFTVHATATDSPGDTLAFSLTAAPVGMTIGAATGLISWTPTVAQIGANPVTVQVTDQGALSATASFTVTVGNTAPVLAPIAAQTAGVDTPFTLLVGATDTANDTLAFSLQGGPAGMTIDPASGLVSWTPAATQVGAHPVTVRVTDLGGLFAETGFTVTVSQDTVSVLQAVFRLRARRWNVQGTSDAPGATITIFNTANLTGAPLGTAVVDAFGVWRFRLDRAARGPNATRRISVRSNAGGAALNVPVTVLP